MDEKQMEQVLSSISTAWTMLRRAQGDSAGSKEGAWQELMQRYCGAVYRYLHRAMRDSHVAEELTQEYALRFIRGSFRNADPGHGRFRDFVKSSLFLLVQDYRRRQGEGVDPLAPDDTVRAGFPRELAAGAAGAHLEGIGGRPAEDGPAVLRSPALPRRAPRHAVGAGGRDAGGAVGAVPERLHHAAVATARPRAIRGTPHAGDPPFPRRRWGTPRRGVGGAEFAQILPGQDEGKQIRLAPQRLDIAEKKMRRQMPAHWQRERLPSGRTKRTAGAQPTSWRTGLPSGTSSMGRPSCERYQVCSGMPSVW